MLDKHQFGNVVPSSSRRHSIMHVDIFFAEHPDAEEICSTNKTVTLVSGEYEDGYPTARATFCCMCGEEIEYLECEDDGCHYSPLYTGAPVKRTVPCYP